jgi:Protein of unknown function (DUF742)
MSERYDPSAHDGGALLRPYAITKGRTRRDDDLEIEALVVTTWLGESAHTQLLEHRSISLLCRQPQSIAEVSAQLRLPLGVVRVLVRDMADQHLVAVHRPGHTDRPDIVLLERVLHGLRRI